MLIALLVDDEPSLLRALARVLSTRFECTSASSVDAAISAIERQRFDVVLVDVNMPDGGAIELASRLRARNDDHEHRLVIITGDDEPYAFPTLRKGIGSDLVQEVLEIVAAEEWSRPRRSRS